MLAKIEVLWSRTCPLSCSYCSMVDKRKNTAPLEDWKTGFNYLRKHNPVIAIFFGAEPLYDFDKLPEVIHHCEQIGIPTTIITSGIVPDFEQKLRTLYESGLKSLSMSFDMVDLNVGSKLKTNKAIEGLSFFKELGPIRDLAAIATLTKTNYHLFPDMIGKMSELGIWSFFDPLHLDRGFPGTKCSSKEGTRELMFTSEDIPGLKTMFRTVLDMKKKGFLVHASIPYLEKMLHLSSTFTGKYKWRCADDICFPSWVTIDCDGRVNCCDDNHPLSNFYIADLGFEWNDFVDYWKNYVLRNCPGCAWNNYEESHLIAKGIVPKSAFVHKENI